MTEREFIDREQAKHDRRLKRRLARVHNTGECSPAIIDTLILADYISFGPPRPGVNDYNCWRLTTTGTEVLRALKGGKP